jgi:nucleotide-binding universal stress UspA family protein
MTGAIICGVDDSESARGAARVARALSAHLGLGLVFVRVVAPGAPDAKVSAIAERLERLTAGATDVDCSAGWLVDVGHPADGLVAAARKLDASLIVVGSTGRRSSLLGSISADVSRRAPCPVVVVPPGADASVNGRATSDGPDFAGAIARFGFGVGGAEFEGAIARFPLGDGGTEFAGGIIRFGFGSTQRGA